MAQHGKDLNDCSNIIAKLTPDDCQNYFKRHLEIIQIQKQ